MMSIGRSSGRENLLWVTGIEPMKMIRTHLANHIRASSREQWLHQQARHMTAPDRNRRHAKKCLTARRRPHMTLAAVENIVCFAGREMQSCLPTLPSQRPGREAAESGCEAVQG